MAKSSTNQSDSRLLSFVQISPFVTSWSGMSLGDSDLRSLEFAILQSPTAAPVVQGTNGVRKLRFSAKAWKTGKSGGARVYYFYVADMGLVLLLFAHRKATQETITAQEKTAIRELVQKVLDGWK